MLISEKDNFYSFSHNKKTEHKLGFFFIRLARISMLTQHDGF